MKKEDVDKSKYDIHCHIKEFDCSFLLCSEEILHLANVGSEDKEKIMKLLDIGVIQEGDITATYLGKEI